MILATLTSADSYLVPFAESAAASIGPALLLPIRFFFAMMGSRNGLARSAAVPRNMALQFRGIPTVPMFEHAHASLALHARLLHAPSFFAVLYRRVAPGVHAGRVLSIICAYLYPRRVGKQVQVCANSKCQQSPWAQICPGRRAFSKPYLRVTRRSKSLDSYSSENT